MGKISDAAKIGYEAVSFGRSVAGFAQAPLKAFRKIAISTGRKAALAILGQALGPQWAARAISRMDIEGKALRAKGSVAIPAKLAKLAMDPKGAQLFEKIANDALSAPFALLGYKIAAISISFDEASNRLTLGFALGALRIDRGAEALPAPELVGKSKKPRKPTDAKPENAQPPAAFAKKPSPRLRAGPKQAAPDPAPEPKRKRRSIP